MPTTLVRGANSYLVRDDDAERSPPMPPVSGARTLSPTRATPSRAINPAP